MNGRLTRLVIIFLLLMSAPLGCWLAGELVAMASADESGLTVTVSVLYGFAAMVVAAILGPIVSLAMKNSNHQYLSLAGYAVPPLLAILYVLFG